jgi:uncharacterized protein with gpF-like domain
LQEVHVRIELELSRQGGELNQAQLRSLRAAIDDHIARFQSELTAAAQADLAGAFTGGEALVSEPLAAAGIEVSFFSPSRAQINAITDFSADLIKQIADEMRAKINTQIQRSFLGAQTPSQAMAQITDILGVKQTDLRWGRLKRPQVVKGIAARAEAILRTEFTRAANMGHMSQLELANTQIPGLMKRWQARGDRRTRKTHLDTHRNTFREPIPVNQPFEVGNDLLMFPGDPNGSAQETINCRCNLLMVTPEFGVTPTPNDAAVKRQIDKRKEKKSEG